MLCAISPNFGMGSDNLFAIEPPSILTDNLSLFAFYDRIYVDGRSYHYTCGEYEQRFFNTLIEAGIVEVRDDLFHKADVRRCQAIFAAVFNADFSEIFNGVTIDFADAEPEDFEKRLLRIDREVGAGYYLQLKNYCAMCASAKLRCSIIGGEKQDMMLRREIKQYAEAGDAVHAVTPDPLAGAFEKLQAALGFEIEDFPLSLDVHGKRAKAMSAINQEVAPTRWPEWFAEHRIDPIESGRRLEAFLRLRRAPYFKEVQAWLASGGTKGADAAWRAALQRDWDEIGRTASISVMAN